MRELYMLAGTALAITGLALGIAGGGNAQTVDGLDLAKVRERARLSPEDAEAFTGIIARRGEALRTEAMQSAAQARANGERYAAEVRPTGQPGDTFDFDAMVAASGNEMISSEDAPRLVAFASLSMPEASLSRMITDVSRAGGVVVFRGFPGNSAKKFTGALARLLPGGAKGTAIGIDPRLFRAFDVTAVPTYVVTSTYFDLCDGFDCRTAVPPHDRMIGNVTAEYALDTFARGGGPGAAVAAVYGDRLAAQEISR
jgi:conjugal transfer pilus assembly protein TrbC